MSDRDRGRDNGRDRDRARPPKRTHSPDNPDDWNRRRNDHEQRDDRGNTSGGGYHDRGYGEGDRRNSFQGNEHRPRGINRSGTFAGADSGGTSAYYENRGERGGYNNNRGSRDGHMGDIGSGRGGYNSERGSRDGFNNSERGSRDGFNNSGRGSRGGFNNERGGGRGGFNNERGGGRGGFNNERGGGRGGFNNERGGGRGGNRRQSPDRDKNVSITLYCNFFQILNNIDWTLHQYQVDFEPPLESKRTKVGLFRRWVYDDVFQSCCAFDGGHTAFSRTKLEDDVNVRNALSRDNVTYVIKVTFIRIVPEGSTDIDRIHNIAFKKALKQTGLQEFGRDRAYFDFIRKFRILNTDVELVNGYKAHFAKYENSLSLLQVDISHKVFSSYNVYQDLQRKDFLNIERRAEAEAYLQNKLVLTTYNNKAYTIEGIEWNLTIDDTFNNDKKDPEKRVTFREYFLDRYQRNIRNTQPLLKCTMKGERQVPGEERPARIQVILVPELCTITGGQLLEPYKSNFNFNNEFKNRTNLYPQDRYEKISEFLNSIRSSAQRNDESKNWEITYPNDLLAVNALLLRQCDIYFGDTPNDKGILVKNNWDQQLKTSKHISSIPLNSDWILLYSEKERDHGYSKAQLFESTLLEIARNMGFRIERSNQIQVDFNYNLSNILKENLEENKNIKMVVCLLPSNNNSHYSAIKKICCLQFGKPSQVITSRIIENAQNPQRIRSVITKVAIQMNCKLGGEIWATKFNLTNVMVVGMNSSKDNVTKEKVTAFVSTSRKSNNENGKIAFTKYYSQCKSISTDSNFYNNLSEFMKAALQHYYVVNKEYPCGVICYRDGVGYNEAKTVREYEVKQIKQAFKEIDNDNIKLAYLIVRKRVSARFFLRDENNQHVNPKNGTAISEKVIKNKGEEFYLISHSASQGTVKPTNYEVLINEFNNMRDIDQNGEVRNNFHRLQYLTYQLTHMYYNWPGQIRVPAPCQYAQKLAHLVGESLHNDNIDPSLKDKLFYL